MASLLPNLATTLDNQEDQLPSFWPFGKRLISVTTAFDCAFSRTMARFLRLSAISQSQIVTSDGRQLDHQLSLSLVPQIFGRGVVLSVKNGKVAVGILESANEALALIATTLLNNSDAVGLHFTIHGRDTHYFVKQRLERATDDIKELSLQREGTIHGLEISIHTHHESPKVVKYVDIRLQRNHTAINLRYGITLASERQQILHHALLRAAESAWVIERELVQSDKLTLNSWSKVEREELLSKGSVSGMQPEYVRSVLDYPQLADDPRNIRFVAVKT